MLILGLASLAIPLQSCGRKEPEPHQAFRRVVVDSGGPSEPWGKAVGDLNGDGRSDLIVGGQGGGGLVWYENPGWQKHTISATEAFSTDHEVADMDGDGRNDVVSLTTDRMVWFRNEGGNRWTMREIDRAKLHDVEVADLDGDGRLDIVSRGQTAFSGLGNRVHLYYQSPQGGWSKRAVDVPHGEGLKVHDMNGDGRPDIIVNGVWLSNPASLDGKWRAYVYARTWTWSHTYIDVGDINDDGRTDIVLSPAELAGSSYRLSWFEAPPRASADAEWIEHVVDETVEAVHHFVGVADFDRDGRADIASAKMHQGKAPAEVKIYLNRGAGRTWEKTVLSTKGSHNMRIVDIDGDGDPDLFGANWSGSEQSPQLWINPACEPGPGCPCWRRHEIDGARPGKAVFVHVADLDGDGRLDVAAGAWWYRNPGAVRVPWERRAFGEPASDIVLVADLDGDGDVDALSTRWREDRHDSRLVFAENDGRGSFRLRPDIASGAGDFLQGVALGRFESHGVWQVALSWHQAGKGIELLTVPKDPAAGIWRLERIASQSQDEALSAGDIDGDGRLDIVQGTQWLRNDGDGKWSVHSIDPERRNPDRNRLADINGDGRLDAVVGFEAISKDGDVVWYEQGPDPTMPWTRHHVATVVGPMSLDVADFDGDGDIDIVVGEHNLEKPDAARLWVLENVDGKGGLWRWHVVHVGDEHHDGALAADLDGDGDQDIVSIGWSHGKVLWYENLGRLGMGQAAECRSSHRRED